MPVPAPDSNPKPHPLTVVRDAVLSAVASGIHVRIGELGVACTSSHGAHRWARDRDAAISPLGAVLLELQPEATEVYAALAEAFDVREAFVHGLEGGLDHEAPSQNWTSTINAGQFLAGYETGSLFREEFLRGVSRGA